MKSSTLVAGLTSLCILATSTSAIACGGAFLLAIMFQKYPEAKTVLTAVRHARDTGELQGDTWPGFGSQSLHSWRAEKVADMTAALEGRLGPAKGAFADTDGIQMFLIEEFVWMEVKSDGQRVSVAPASSAPGKDAPKAFTTRRVLDNLLDGTITWREVVDGGLIASRCTDGCQVEPLALLGRAFAGVEKALVSPSDFDQPTHVSLEN